MLAQSCRFLAQHNTTPFFLRKQLRHIMANQAAWIKQKQAQLEVDAADKYNTGAGELLVKVDVIGFSPIESKTQK
jgi:hypothetical protein